MFNTSQFFDLIFKNARTNAILIMDVNGVISSVNGAFTAAFGYTTEDLKGKHFRLLFVEKDKATRRPEIELNQTHRTGASSDENYLVHKDDTPIWVTGESILVNAGDTSCIVKIIHNIHAQKQLERYLMSSTELLESLFESVQQSGLILLNSQMKVLRTNSAFRKMFGIEMEISEGSKLQDIGHVLWGKEELRQDVRNILVRGIPFSKDFIVDVANHTQRFEIASKLIAGEGTETQQLLLVIKQR